MSAQPWDVPLPPELAVDEAPFSDEDLGLLVDRYDEERGRFVVDDEAAEAEDYTPEAHRAAVVNRWQVGDDEQAEWSCRKLAAERAEVARLRAQADEWAARIEAWFVQAAKAHERSAAFFEGRLVDYGLARRERTGEATLRLPSGVVRTSEAKPKAGVVDDEVLADWVTEHWATLAPDEAVFADLETVVRRAAKVYLGPFRKLVRVEDVADGYDWTARLVCGHERSGHVEQVDDAMAPFRGEIIECRDCPPDRASQPPSEYASSSAVREGMVAGRAVESVELAACWRPAVLGPDGNEVPGTTVEPGGVTAKVETT